MADDLSPPVPPPMEGPPPPFPESPVSVSVASPAGLAGADDNPDDPDDPIPEERNFREAHIVRGRARHPQSQGEIERRNGQFKEALQNWMQENNTTSWR